MDTSTKIYELNSKHMKSCQYHQWLRKQKFTLQWDTICTKMAKIKETGILCASEYVVQLEFSYFADSNEKCYSHFGKQADSVL